MTDSAARGRDISSGSRRAATPGVIAAAASVLIAAVALFGYFLAYFTVLPTLSLIVFDVVVMVLWTGRSRLLALLSLVIAVATLAYVSWFLIIGASGLG